jgi:rod shape-determining protein MreD
MNRPQYILLPVNPLFIMFSLVCAFLLNVLPTGQLIGIPDFVALVLLFWNIHQPRKVGMGIAFVFGLLMDVQAASLLGEHALAYTLLSYGAIMLHRRVLWFSLLGQMPYVLLLLVIAQSVPFTIHLFSNAFSPAWTYWLDSLIGTALWPIITVLLLAPQKRAADHDDTRPI